MKKIFIIVVLLAAAGGAGYVLTKKQPDVSQQTNSNSNPPPAIPSPEGMDDSMESVNPPVTPVNPAPTPPAAPSLPPAGGPVQDDMGDVDVAPPKVFNITGRNFSFSQSELKVKKGDRVIINFESTDGFHDWSISEFSVHTDRVGAGQKSSVEFVADKTGTFEYYCSVSSHRAAGMVGKLIVE